MINLDAGGAFRADSQPLAALDDLAVLDQAILGEHTMAINRLWGGYDWIDLVSLRDKTWRQNLQAFANGYGNRFSRYFDFASAYRLRSSHNQIRYLIHLARHERGRDKFKEAFEASELFGLLAVGKLDQVAAFKAAEAYHSHYRNSRTTVEQLLEERLGTYAKQDLLTICDAAQTYGLGSFDPRQQVITWNSERLNLDALLFDVAAG